MCSLKWFWVCSEGGIAQLLVAKKEWQNSSFATKTLDRSARVLYDRCKSNQAVVARSSAEGASHV